MSIQKYDVVIVGAGVAGLESAYRIASAGYRVVVVESKPFDRIGDKTCGDAIGIHHFKELGWTPPSNVIDHRYDGVKIYSPSEEHSITVPGEGVSLNRLGFGQWMLKRALDKNVDLYDRCWVSKVVVKDNTVEKIEVKRSGLTETIELYGRVFIDASGAKPAVRSKLPVEWPISERPYMSDYNIAYREVIELENPIKDDVNYAQIYLNTEIAPGGYWWLFPKNSDGTVINIGLGVVMGVANYNPRINYEKYLRNRFKGRVVHSGGGLVPTRRPLPTLVWRNVVVVGDAAYTVNPVHGGGIGSSMLAAMIASKHIVKALENGVVDENSLWGVNIDYMNAYGAKQAGLDIVRMYLQKLSNDDFEWLIKNKIVDSGSVYALGYEGSLTDEIIQNISRGLKLLLKPSMLNQLRIVKKYMDRMVKLHREEYPDKPGDIFKWINTVDNLLDEYRKLIGYNPGEKVKW